MSDGVYEPFPDITAWTAVPFDPTTYDQYAALLEHARAEATEEARERAVRTAIRYAGTDTGAIEGLYTTDRGFTRTVAIEAAHWEAAANERGPNAAAIIKDQIEAYEWVLDLVTQKRPVTEHVIRELHAMLCRSQEFYVVQTDVGEQKRPLPKGEYKTFPNNPTSLATGTVHHYAPVDMVGPEMARLVASLSTEEYQATHPVVQAAYLHYAVAAIHPFADGNGRTTRALSSVPLYRALGVPLMVLRDDRDEYLDALGAADARDLGRFVSFVADRVIETVDLVLLTIRAGAAADHARSLDRLRRVVDAQRTHEEMDAVAGRLTEAALRELAEQARSLDLPPGVDVAVGAVFGSVNPYDPGYRSPSEGRAAKVIATSTAPANARVTTAAQAKIALQADVAPLFLVAGTIGVPFTLHDVEPTLRSFARIKLSTFAAEVLADVLARLSEEAENALRQAGYRI